MSARLLTALAVLAPALCPNAAAQRDDVVAHDAVAPAQHGWLSWRGPQQDGTSLETGLPERVASEAGTSTWTYPLAGRGTPVVAGERVFAFGYDGEGPDLQEVLVCLDARSGKRLWEQRFNDFLSDTIYQRYSIGSPTVDPDTGNVLCLSSAGELTCFTADGEQVWQRCMMAEVGRMTFPNGRTGSPLVDGELAIVHVVSAAWGPHGPARDRFYAYDKRTGESVWTSVPGESPQDNPMSLPVLAFESGRRVLYATTGCGHLVCIDVRTGDPIWRYHMSVGGMNSSAVLHGDTVIAIHGRENLDSSAAGRMVAVARGGKGQLDKSAERWRADLGAFSSSPVLVGSRIYQTTETGDLHCVDADTGKVLWHVKLAPDQIHASPAWGDGKLYVPMNNGSFHICKPTDEGPNVVQSLQLAGNCLGAPAIANGRVYVHTTDRLYCFAGPGGQPKPVAPAAATEPAPGAPVRLQVIPADFVARQGDTVRLRARSLDANGLVVADPASDVTWSGLPPRGVAIEGGALRVAADAPPMAGMLQAGAGGLAGAARLRIVPAVPFTIDFANAKAPSPPPPYWLGAGPKWEIRELDGDKVLARKLDNPLFQRTMSLLGHPSETNYTMQADIRSDGNRRTLSSGGVINQRYLIMLKGNHQELEVSSNEELFKVGVKFAWQAGKWYRLKTRVDVAADGAGVVRAKAWPRDEAEPDAWTIEVPHARANTHGAPGVYGFTPQSRFAVYIDNIVVTKND
jgi:outer membrane protein assembly factor BamB